jgi:DNA-binding transcriptional regulator YhcF (GntR family)
MSVKALNWAFEQVTDLPVDKIVLLALADYADQDGCCFPSQDTLAKRGMCSIDTIGRVLKRLVGAGMVERSKRYAATGNRTSDTYRLILDHTTSSALNRNLRSSDQPTRPQIADQSTPHSYAATTPQSCGVHIEPSLNLKKITSAKPNSENQKPICDPLGVVYENGSITMDAGNTEFWLIQFDGDRKGLELALIQAASYVQPNSQTRPMAAQVGAQLARAVASRRDQDRRYAAGVNARASAPKVDRSNRPGWAVEKDEKLAATKKWLAENSVGVSP